MRGWEPAADAQSRIVCAVELAVSQTLERVNIAIVGHGGTGTLLYCHLAGVAINRRYDQPATNGGNWFAFDRASRKLLCDGWQSIDVVAGGNRVNQLKRTICRYTGARRRGWRASADTLPRILRGQHAQPAVTV
jgi:hypothetical protein